MPAILRIAFVLSCIASQGCSQTAPTCAFTGPTVFPEMEKAKAAFLAGDYPGFFALVAAQMPNFDAAGAVTGIEGVVPDGFDSCTTVIQREDVGGLVQEITLFQVPGDKGPIGLYMQSALIDGQRVILQFNFNTTLGEVLESLR